MVASAFNAVIQEVTGTTGSLVLPLSDSQVQWSCLTSKTILQEIAHSYAVSSVKTHLLQFLQYPQRRIRYLLQPLIPDLPVWVYFCGLG